MHFIQVPVFRCDVSSCIKRTVHLFQITFGPALWVLDRTLGVSSRVTFVCSQLSSFLPLAFPSSWALRAHPFLHGELTAVASVLLFPVKQHEKKAKKPMLIVTVIKSQVQILSQGSAWVKSQAQQQSGCFRSGSVPHAWALSSAEIIASGAVLSWEGCPAFETWARLFTWSHVVVTACPHLKPRACMALWQELGVQDVAKTFFLRCFCPWEAVLGLWRAGWVMQDVDTQRTYLSSVGARVMGVATQHSFVESGPDPSTSGCKSGVVSQMTWSCYIGFLEVPKGWGSLVISILLDQLVHVFSCHLEVVSRVSAILEFGAWDTLNTGLISPFLPFTSLDFSTRSLQNIWIHPCDTGVRSEHATVAFYCLFSHPSSWCFTP